MRKQAIGVVAATLLFASSGYAAGVGGSDGVAMGVERHSPVQPVQARGRLLEIRTDGRFPTPQFKKVIWTQGVRTDNHLQSRVTGHRVEIRTDGRFPTPQLKKVIQTR